MQPLPKPPEPTTGTVLVVEDDEMIASAVAARLRSEGIRTEVVNDGLVAVRRAAELRPDAIVLDLMLPGLDGLEVCRRIQAERPVPVLMLTAKDDEVDMLVGLRVGADDYMTKPFSSRELVARVHALLRRARLGASTTTDDVRRLAGADLDVPRRTVTVAGEPVHLTATEFDVLVALSDAPGVVRSRADLVREVWGFSDEAAERTVDSHVRAIRRKLGDDVIRTVRGVGYAAGEADA